jgi:RNA polymerase sigma factor (sigma-70 family)
MQWMDGATAALSATRAFEDFFEAEHTRLLRTLYLLTGNREEAEEVLQDAFVAIWERWDRIAVMDDPVGYLYRTALNAHRSRLRRGLRMGRRAVGRARGGDLFAEVEEREAVARALADLPPRRREAVVLTGLLEMTSKEAADVMGITDVTVRRLAQDGREQLRRMLMEASDDG